MEEENKLVYEGDIKPGYFKFRDLAHLSQSRQTIPENLRAVEKPRYYTRYNRQERIDILLQWIKDHPKKLIKTDELARIIGFKSGSTAWRLAYDLEREHKIRWVGHNRSRYLELVDQPIPAPELSKGDPRNGEVLVSSRPPMFTPEETERITESVKGAIMEALPEPEHQNTPAPSAPTKVTANNMVIVEQLNALVWRYLKSRGPANNHHSISVTDQFQILREFALWMDNLAEDEDGKAEKEESLR